MVFRIWCTKMSWDQKIQRHLATCTGPLGGLPTPYYIEEKRPASQQWEHYNFLTFGRQPAISWLLQNRQLHTLCTGILSNNKLIMEIE